MTTSRQAWSRCAARPPRPTSLAVARRWRAPLPLFVRALTRRPSLPATNTRPQVNEAFKDLSAIVDEQGHAIEQIEVNVADAHANTEKGVGYLQVRQHR